MNEELYFYAAGGAIRDLLLGKKPRDVDFSFHGTDAYFLQRYPSARKLNINNSRLYINKGQEYSPLLHNCIATDLINRDFTINAFLLDKNGVLHMDQRALTDLKNKIIRPVSATSLYNDPIRLFRAARFTTYIPAFMLHQSCIEQAAVLSIGSLNSIAAERVGQETLKACTASHPGNFLRSIVRDLKETKVWFTEFSTADGTPNNRNSRLERTTCIMNATAASAFSYPLSESERRIAVWMALCHDLDTITTPPTNLRRHSGHEGRVSNQAITLGQRLRLPAKFIKAGSTAALLYRTAKHYTVCNPGTKVDLLCTLAPHNIMLPFLIMASCGSSQPNLPSIAMKDWAKISSAHLPSSWKNKGHKSAIRLRELRIATLSR